MHDPHENAAIEVLRCDVTYPTSLKFDQNQPAMKQFSVIINKAVVTL